MTTPEVRARIVRVCRLLYERGLIAGPDGNVSVRIDDDRIIATPSGRAKGGLEPADLVELDLDGRVVGGGRPSSEILMHLAAYKRRPDVRAVVHAHPPTATGFAVAGEGIPADVLPEVIVQMGVVALVPYATPGTDELPLAMAPLLDDHDAFLLANHGATTFGATLEEAHARMESLEHAARILLTARQLGTVNGLTDVQLQALDRLRRMARREQHPGER